MLPFQAVLQVGRVDTVKIPSGPKSFPDPALRMVLAAHPLPVAELLVLLPSNEAAYVKVPSTVFPWMLLFELFTNTYPVPMG